MKLTVIYRDEHLLAIDKPSGLPSVRERWTERESALALVLALVREQDEGSAKPRVVHRLDKGTSGVLLFATSIEAARSLSRQFRDREVNKTYLALVLGTPTKGEGRIEILIDDHRGRPGPVAVAKKRGKLAVTDYRVIEAFRGYSLLEVHPRTGRTHQIRVSLRHIGYPLLVDTTYGRRDRLLLSSLKPGYKQKKHREEIPLIGRLSLHALRTVITHPVSGERVTVESPIPKDFNLALKYLRRHREIEDRTPRLG